ncbi:protein DDI1 homolog 2-like [Oppia nitens]|uniref:protein DDI1 homolog 2-like n=1 Tax=Oppia nitens TaxID=1686743 RepID=UPI0023DAB686|nr:protein DDI1 homolog 2-like [Oppia nitens]
MKLTITTMTDLIFGLEVSDDMEVENLKALCEFESGISAQQMMVMFEGRQLTDDKMSLKSYAIKDGDVLLIQKKTPVLDNTEGQGIRQSAGPSTSSMLPDFSQISVPTAGFGGNGGNGGGLFGRGIDGQPSPQQIRDQLLANPDQLAALRVNNPRLAEAVDAGADQFQELYNRLLKDHMDRERQRLRMLLADPFDAEAQRLIAQEIEQKNIDSNMENAMEYLPESFGQVLMLYIDCTVNGFPIKAFVDSGAQSTIMSKACAERCNITRLIDQRWSGIAKGVGTQRIIGRIHLCQIQIANDYLASSFTILEDQPMDMLLGLDMLKRHQCSIDLKRNLLVIGTTGTETRFLNENELPEFAKHKAMSGSGGGGSGLADGEADVDEAIRRSLSDSNKPNTSSSSSNTGVVNEFPEPIVRELMGLGFNRDQVVEELRKYNGDKNQAMAALFAKSLSVPK